MLRGMVGASLRAVLGSADDDGEGGCDPDLDGGFGAALTPILRVALGRLWGGFEGILTVVSVPATIA
jgi:hypothetical protein